MGAYIERYLWGTSGVLIQHQLHQRLNFTLVRPPPPLHHPSTTFARALTASNLAWRPGNEPLPSIEGCGLRQHRPSSLTSEDAAAAAPPLSQGMWATWTRSMVEPGREEDEGGTHEVECPTR